MQKSLKELIAEVLVEHFCRCATVPGTWSEYMFIADKVVKVVNEHEQKTAKAETQKAFMEGYAKAKKHAGDVINYMRNEGETDLRSARDCIACLDPDKGCTCGED